MVATDSSRSSVRTRYAAPHPGPPPRLSVAVAGLAGFGGCVVSIDPWRLWPLCGYFATTFLSAPLRRSARVPQGGLGGPERPSAASWAFTTGGVQGARRRRHPPTESSRLRSRPPQASAPASAGRVSWCGDAFAAFSRCVRDVGSAPPAVSSPSACARGRARGRPGHPWQLRAGSRPDCYGIWIDPDDCAAYKEALLNSPCGGGFDASPIRRSA